MTDPRRGSIAGRSAGRGRVLVPSLAVTLVAGWSLVGATAVVADPADVPPPTTAPAGQYNAVVPDGACSVSATIQGGAGGSAIAIAGANGAGARITTTIPIVPGQKITGVIGGSGGPSQNTAGGTGLGGSNGGGDGGTSTGTGGIYHHGSGGGGFSTLLIEGQEVVVAGGGGGSGGGHAADAGFGGDAGLPTGFGVTPGSPGQDGRDTVGNVVSGGGAGTAATPGAGGTNSGDPIYDGSPGVARQGGNGGDDPTPDAGGGGGGGYFAGGGGAATVGNGSGGVTVGGIGAGGGGGGASFIANLDPTGRGNGPTGISSQTGPKTNTAGAGADGTAKLDWVPCDYDLEVTKVASPQNAPQGTDVTWTVKVTNNGPDPMTSGDLVSLTDNAAGQTKITSITVSGGTPSGLGNAAVSCDASVGDALPATLTCSRPYDAPDALGTPSGGQRGLDVDVPPPAQSASSNSDTADRDRAIGGLVVDVCLARVDRRSRRWPLTPGAPPPASSPPRHRTLTSDRRRRELTRVPARPMSAPSQAQTTSQPTLARLSD